MANDKTTAYEAVKKAGKTVEAYPKSWNDSAGSPVFAANIDSTDYLVALGTQGMAASLAGGKALNGGLTAFPMNYQNRLILNQALPYTAPTSLAHEPRTFGVGDRLGVAGYAHFLTMEHSTVKPVIAQQSMRELTLTGRSYKDVMDAAAWAAFKAGWQGGYGADGDHLKNAKDIQGALGDGYTMITLDCSENLKTPPADEGELARVYGEIDSAYRTYCEDAYLNNSLAEKLGVAIDRPALMRAVIAFKDALSFIVDIYRNVIQKAGRRIDFEVSVDETPFETEPAAHFFVANELKKAGVVADSMAPRFVGEFQKAIDYIGDVTEFHRTFAIHCAIAQEFDYKISVHSGSDKFSIYPSVSELTKGRFHVKTAGTNWLEAVGVIAKKTPALYRKMHTVALESLEDAKKLYVVHCDLANIKPLEQVADADLYDAYLTQNDARQLLHITYGSMFERGLKPEIYAALATCREDYEQAIYRHIGKHLKLLNCWNGE